LLRSAFKFGRLLKNGGREGGREGSPTVAP